MRELPVKRLRRVTAPRVIEGRVQRKNHTAPTPTYFNTARDAPVIHRLRPGRGYRHFLLQREVTRFLALLPDWPELSRGLKAVLLAPGHPRYLGWYDRGVVAVCAWTRDPWFETDYAWFDYHRAMLGRFGVPCVVDHYRVVCRFTPAAVRTFQLVHVLLHELGHHHDLMTTRSRRDCARGESYADEYAWRYEALIWERYLNEFGLD
jgi:hypothetical protein